VLPVKISFFKQIKNNKNKNTRKVSTEKFRIENFSGKIIKFGVKNKNIRRQFPDIGRESTTNSRKRCLVDKVDFGRDRGYAKSHVGPEKNVSNGRFGKEC
jgi:hypothetical protein